MFRKDIIASILLIGNTLFAGEEICSAPSYEACCPSYGPDWMITPNAGPCVDCGYDVFVTLEFLYWTAREDHLAFAINEKVDNGSVISKGKVFKPDWNFQPGFKVGVGILYDHDGWDLYANYTWLCTKDTKKVVHRDGNERLEFITYFQAEAERISGNWKHRFNVVDFALGRNFFISRCLKLRPHFGLKGTWQKQKFNISGTEFNSQTEVIIRNKMDYWGIGLRAGLDSSWHFTRCISLVGEVAATALWERFKSDYKVVEEPNTITNLEDHFHTVKPVLEFLMGLRWETWFCCDRYHFSAEGGWEIQWWGNQNQFLNNYFENFEGDLLLQGFTGRIRFDF